MNDKKFELEQEIKLVGLQTIPLLEAMKRVGAMPLDEHRVSGFTQEDIMVWDCITVRFSKIQDSIVQKIMPHFLEILGENVERASFIDKLNKLERLGIIESMYRWKELRNLRNHLAHEYSDRPELLASFLNQTYKAIPELLQCVDAMAARLEKTVQ